MSFSQSVNAVDALVARDRLQSSGGNNGGDYSVAGGSEFGGGHGSINRIMEFDVVHSPSSGRRSPNQSFAGNGRERGSTGGSRMGAISEAGRSRGGSGISRGLTPFSRDSQRSDRGESSSTLLGTASVLIVRMRGEVHGVETTRCIIERVDTSADAEAVPKRRVMAEYVLPQTLPFIPPVGKRRDDPEIQAAHSKTRVNLECVTGRDAELRTMASAVMDIMFKDILCAADARDATRCAITGVDPAALSDGSSSGARVSSTYGLYFSEVRGMCRSALSLEQRLVLEAQYLGYTSVTASAANNDVVDVKGMPSLWREASDDAERLLCVDLFALRLSDIRMLLGANLRITSDDCPHIHSAVEIRLVLVNVYCQLCPY